MSVTYDDWGRMAGKTRGACAATYGYRFGDKLKSVNANFPGETASGRETAGTVPTPRRLGAGQSRVSLGKRRLEQLDGTTVTWFRWSGWEESGEYGGTPNTWTVGAKQTGYVPGLAAFAGADPATADWRFNLNDHLGSPRQMLGQDKSAKARFDFSPYGELMRSAGLPLTVGYTGHRWDPAIGQYFAPFRYYNPQTARWNMRDPMNMVDGPNVYAYVAGNPISANDILGLDRSLCMTGHMWITVDTWDDAGNKTGSRILNFGPAGEKDMRDYSGFKFPALLWWTIPSTPDEDKFLLDAWRDYAREKTEQWTPWNNCWIISLAWCTVGIPDPPDEPEDGPPCSMLDQAMRNGTILY